MTDVTVLGTGRMGIAISRALLTQGLNVRVWNQTAVKTEPLISDPEPAPDRPRTPSAPAR